MSALLNMLEYAQKEKREPHKFDNENYYYCTSYGWKSSAESVAKDARSLGFKSRVVKDAQRHEYHIYIRKK